MLKKVFACIGLILLITSSTQAQLGRGCLIEQRDTQLIQKRNFPKSLLPASYSLEKYAPPALSQGNLNSCTAWSSAYCGLTICKRIESDDVNAEPYSPLNLFNRLKTKESEDPCIAGGAYVSEALTMLQDQGCARFSEYSNTCNYTNATVYYDDKLYAFEELNVKTFDIKSAIAKNSPVVMVIPFLSNGWDVKENLPNGIWNGNYGTQDGYHAMTIIAYDDNVGQGGAFLVQNSWGDDWGKKGCFWLQYKDLWHVHSVFMMSPNPNGSANNNGDYTNEEHYNDHSNTHQVFRIYNECSVTAYVALSQYEENAWVNKGWYAAPAGDYIDLEIGNRGTDDIYWMALNNGNNLVWYDEENGTNMCYDPKDKFTIYDNATPACPQYIKWFKETPGYEGLIYSQTLTCPGNNSRNNKIKTVYQPKVKDEKHDNRPPDIANLNWEEGYELVDLYSKRIIHPTNGDYTVWYIDTDNSIKKAELSSKELAKLRAYKFISKENAERWLNSR